MSETILGNLSFDAVLFIIPHTIDFSVDIKFLVIFHPGGGYTLNECLLNRHREILTDKNNMPMTSVMGAIASILN